MKRTWISGIAVLGLGIAALTTWQAQAQDRFLSNGGPLFEGVSDNGNFQEALDNAILAAHEGLCPNCADFLVAWRIEDVSGRNGGFAYTNEITVTIQAQ